MKKTDVIKCDHIPKEGIEVVCSLCCPYLLECVREEITEAIAQATLKAPL